MRIGKVRMRRETKSMQNIKRMCVCSMLDPDEVLHRSTLVMQVYRDVVWMTTRRAKMMRENILEFSFGKSLDTALAYLFEFAPNERRQEFEARVSSMFETKWLVDLIDNAMMRVYNYPDKGKLYFGILSKGYMSAFKYSEIELLEEYHLERSAFYDRKREALMLLGVSLWGFAIPEIKEIFEDFENKAEGQFALY